MSTSRTPKTRAVKSVAGTVTELTVWYDLPLPPISLVPPGIASALVPWLVKRIVPTADLSGTCFTPLVGTLLLLLNSALMRWACTGWATRGAAGGSGAVVPVSGGVLVRGSVAVTRPGAARPGRLRPAAPISTGTSIRTVPRSADWRGVMTMLAVARPGGLKNRIALRPARITATPRTTNRAAPQRRRVRGRVVGTARVMARGVATGRAIGRAGMKPGVAT